MVHYAHSFQVAIEAGDALVLKYAG